MSRPQGSNNNEHFEAYRRGERDRGREGPRLQNPDSSFPDQRGRGMRGEGSVGRGREGIYMGKENFANHNLKAEPIKEIEQNIGVNIGMEWENIEEKII